MTSNANNYNSPEPFYSSFGQPDQNPSAQNPSLLPQWDPVLGGESSFDFVSISKFLALNPRNSASCAVTLTGTVTTNDFVGVALTNPILANAAVVVGVQAGGSDTLSSLALKLANLLNSNPTLQGYGVYCTASGAVITANWPGPCGNLATLSAWSYTNTETATVGGTATATDIVSLNFGNLAAANTGELTASGTPATGDVVTATFTNPFLAGGAVSASYTVQVSDTLALIATGLRTAIAAASGLAPLSLTSNAVGAVVFLAWSASVGTLYVSTTVTRAATEAIALAAQSGMPASFLAPSPLPSELVTITGAATATDLLQLTIQSPQLGKVIVSYAVQGGDSTTAMAAGLAAAINANAQLAAATIVAVPSTNTITIGWSPSVLGAYLGIQAAVLGVPTEALNYTAMPATVSVAYVVQVSDTTTLIATGLKNLINANAILAALGIVATSASAVISIFTNQALAAPTFTRTLSVGATETVAFANTGVTATLTVGGTAKVGDVLTVAVATAFGTFSFSYTVIVGDTLNSIATALGAAINADGQLTQYGFSASVLSAVVSVQWGGNAGAVSFTPTVTRPTGSTTTTVTAGGSVHSTTTATYSNAGGAFAGGTGPIIPLSDFGFVSTDQFGSGYQTFRKGLPALVDYNTLTQMAVAQLPVS